ADIGEERLHRIKILRREGIELVVVAFGASQGRAEPYRAQRADSIGSVLREIFLGLQPALARSAIQAVIRRRDFLIDRRIGQKIARELLARELIERLVVAKRFEDV